MYYDREKALKSCLQLTFWNWKQSPIVSISHKLFSAFIFSFFYSKTGSNILPQAEGLKIAMIHAAVVPAAAVVAAVVAVFPEYAAVAAAAVVAAVLLLLQQLLLLLLFLFSSIKLLLLRKILIFLSSRFQNRKKFLNQVFFVAPRLLIYPDILWPPKFQSNAE